MDEKLIVKIQEMIEVALPVHMHLKGSESLRIARACAPLAYRAGMERAAGIAEDYTNAFPDDAECTDFRVAGEAIAADIRKEAGEATGSSNLEAIKAKWPTLIDGGGRREGVMDEKVIEEMARAIDDACVAWQKAHEYVPVERWDVPGEVMAKAAYPIARAAALREAAGIAEKRVDKLQCAINLGGQTAGWYMAQDEARAIAAALLKEAETTEAKQ